MHVAEERGRPPEIREAGITFSRSSISSFYAARYVARGAHRASREIFTRSRLRALNSYESNDALHA